MRINWKQIVGQVAPILGGAIGGPFGATATRFIASKLLGNPDASEKELSAAVLAASPEMLGELKKADTEFRTKMAELGFKEEELRVKDRENARRLASRVNMIPQMILSVLFIGGYFIVLSVVHGLLRLPDDSINQNLIALASGLLGLLTGEVPRIMAFWFGSSSGSKEKTAKMGATQ